MTITLNHTIVPTTDNEGDADFLAALLGVERLPPSGREGHFAPVRVNPGLTLDFMTVPAPSPVHLAFEVDADEFDAILARVRGWEVPYGSSPADPTNGRTDHPLVARGFFFRDSAGNLYEVMSRGTDSSNVRV